MQKSYTAPRNYLDRAFQLTCELNVKKTLEEAVNYNSKLIYDWLRGKFPSIEWSPKIPKDKSFTRTIPGHKIGIFYRSNEIFCCQIEEVDRDAPGRMWTTEAEISLQDEKVLFGVKVSYTTPENSDLARNKFSIPGFVFSNKKIPSIAMNNGFSDVRKLKGTVLRANSEEKLHELYDLVTNQDRIFPVIVFTDLKDEFGNNFKPIVEPELLLQTEVALIAHVAHISGDLTMKWKELVGENWDVYNGAVRTYYKNVDFDDESDLYRHPLFTAQRISSYRYVNNKGEEKIGALAFIALLIEKIKNNDMRMRIDWKGRGHKFLNVAAREAYEESTEKEWGNFYEDLYKEQINIYKEKIINLEKDKASVEAELKTCEEDLNKAESKIYSLEQRIDELNKKLLDAGNNKAIIPAACTYEDIPAWIEEHFKDRLYLTNRALRSLSEAADPKNSSYENIYRVYEWLQFLGTEYWLMRKKELSRKLVMDRAKELHIGNIDEPPTTESRKGEQDGEYDVDYNGKKHSIDFHLKAGVAHENKYSLRIYYFWDEENSLVVICYLPGHLDTRNT